MSVSREVIMQLAADKEREALRAYNDSKLAQTQLTPQEKIILLSLNQHDRLTILKRIQKHTLDHLFKTNPQFYTKNYHYDWWAFPMFVPKAWRWPERNYLASVNLEEARTLLNDMDFVKTYLIGITLYLNALDKNGWNDYPVRFARMLQSISLFFEAARTMVSTTLIEKGIEKVAIRSAIFAVEQDFIKTYADYPLLLDGLAKVQKQVDICVAEELTSSPAPATKMV